VTRLNGARGLLDDYVQLGLPVALTNDPLLYAGVLGPAHLLDNSGTDNEITTYFQNAYSNPPATDPAGPNGALETTMKQEVAALASRLRADIASGSGATGKRSATARQAAIVRCKGAGTVRTTKHLRRSTVVAARNFSLGPGQKLTITLSPNATARKLLSSYAKLRVTLTLTLLNEAKVATVRRINLTLVGPKPSRRHG
jgi:hypothetical protein